MTERTRDGFIASRQVRSNQNGPHPDLATVVQKHWHQSFRKPVSETTLQVFRRADQLYSSSGRPVILDSGCGTGISTQRLATLYPNHLVLGIDHSLHRLAKKKVQDNISNAHFFRVDLIDFWRLVVKAEWRVDRNFLLFPNPWPKKQHFKRRFHGHPIFSALLSVSPSLEIRSNWRLYLEEFSLAVYLITNIMIQPQSYTPERFLTPFEEKYHKSGQLLYRLVLSGLDPYHYRPISSK